MPPSDAGRVEGFSAGIGDAHRGRVQEPRDKHDHGEWLGGDYLHRHGRDGYWDRHHGSGWYTSLWGWGWGWGWGGYYYPYSWYYPYGYYPYGYWGWGGYGPTMVVHYDQPLGAIDLNVKPKDTEVYLDGQLIGNTGEYDGWPRYLWLNEGSYELILYKPGYETVLRNVTIHTDVVIDFQLRMQPGSSVPPQELSRVAYGATGEPEPGSPGPWANPPDYGRPPQGYAPPEEPLRGREVDPSRPQGPSLDARAEPGRLRLSVEPADASIYLDGHFIGTGMELEQLSAGLLVDAGEHVIQVLHPNRESRKETFTVAPGETVQLDLRLQS